MNTNNIGILDTNQFELQCLEGQKEQCETVGENNVSFDKAVSTINKNPAKSGVSSAYDCNTTINDIISNFAKQGLDLNTLGSKSGQQTATLGLYQLVGQVYNYLIFHQKYSSLRVYQFYH